MFGGNGQGVVEIWSPAEGIGPPATLSGRYPLVLLCCSCCTGALTMFDLVLLIVFSLVVLLQDRRGVCAPRAGDSCRSSAAGALDGVSQTTVDDTCWQGPRLAGGRLSVAGPAARRAAGRCRRRRPRLPRLRVRRPRRPPGTRQLRARAPERAFTTPADRRQRSLGSAGCSAAAAGGARAGAGAGRSAASARLSRSRVTSARTILGSASGRPAQTRRRRVSRVRTRPASWASTRRSAYAVAVRSTGRPAPVTRRWS